MRGGGELWDAFIIPTLNPFFPPSPNSPAAYYVSVGMNAPSFNSASKQVVDVGCTESKLCQYLYMSNGLLRKCGACCTDYPYVYILSIMLNKSYL